MFCIVYSFFLPIKQHDGIHMDTGKEILQEKSLVPLPMQIKLEIEHIGQVIVPLDEFFY
jgi:hypothetical protein